MKRFTVKFTFEFFRLLGGEYALRVYRGNTLDDTIQHPPRERDDFNRAWYAMKLNLRYGVPHAITIKHFDDFLGVNAAAQVQPFSDDELHESGIQPSHEPRYIDTEYCRFEYRENMPCLGRRNDDVHHGLLPGTHDFVSSAQDDAAPLCEELSAPERTADEEGEA